LQFCPEKFKTQHYNVKNQKHLTIIATVIAVSGKQGLLREAQLNLVTATLKEEGCVRYELHHSIDNPETSIFVETWATEAHWEAHMQGEAIKAFEASGAGDFIAKLSMEKLTKVAG
jgi:quinol monooxygenase YgiN